MTAEGELLEPVRAQGEVDPLREILTLRVSISKLEFFHVADPVRLLDTKLAEMRYQLLRELKLPGDTPTKVLHLLHHDRA